MCKSRLAGTQQLAANRLLHAEQGRQLLYTPSSPDAKKWITSLSSWYNHFCSILQLAEARLYAIC